tara:strand:+ start:194 stop:517 length:324 start_codon:yes stop_codon:yes gene_type:complete
MRSNIKSEFNELTTADSNPTGGKTTLPDGTVINWQDGIKNNGQNGAFIEDVITAAIERIEYFNDSKFRCRENSVAITKLEEALMWLRYRTSNRETQGVENTYTTHNS